MIPEHSMDGSIDLISPLSLMECCNQIDASLAEKSIVSIMTSMSCFFGDRTGESFTVCTGAEVSAVNRSLIFNGFLYQTPKGTLIKGNLHTAGYSTVQRFSAVVLSLIGGFLLLLSGILFYSLKKAGGSLELPIMISFISLFLLFFGFLGWNAKDSDLAQTKLMIKVFLEQTLQAHSPGKVI